MPTQPNTKYIAARLFGMNPRLPLARGKAVLRVEPAANTTLRYTRRGEQAELRGVIGAAIVVHDPGEALEFDENGRLRLRVMSAAELRRFAMRLLEYADLLDTANAIGVDLRDAAAAYFDSDRGDAVDGARRRRGRRGHRGQRGDDELSEDVVV